MREWKRSHVGRDPSGGIRRRDYYLALAEAAELRLSASDQLVWLDRLEQDYDNLRAALAWALERGEAEIALRLSSALAVFWEVRGYFREGRTWLERALAQSASVPTALRAKGLNAAGSLASEQNDFMHARLLLQESLALFRYLGDRNSSAATLSSLGHAELYQGNYEHAATLFEESQALYRALRDTLGIASSLNNLGLVASYRGDSGQAAVLFAESLALFRELEETRGIADVLSSLGNG